MQSRFQQALQDCPSLCDAEGCPETDDFQWRLSALCLRCLRGPVSQKHLKTEMSGKEMRQLFTSTVMTCPLPEAS